MKLAWLVVTVSLTVTQAAILTSCEVSWAWEVAMVATLAMAWVLLVVDFLGGDPWPG